jgi:hypothetical protein
MKMSDKIKDPTNISALQDLARGVNSDIGCCFFYVAGNRVSSRYLAFKNTILRTTLIFFIIPLENRQAARRRWQHSKIDQFI